MGSAASRGERKKSVRERQQSIHEKILKNRRRLIKERIRARRENIKKNKESDRKAWGALLQGGGETLINTSKMNYIDHLKATRQDMFNELSTIEKNLVV